jgi:hypothetical protein
LELNKVWGILLVIGLFSTCKAMQSNIQDLAIEESTVATVAGHTVAAGGVYKDPADGRKKVNLTIDKVPNIGLAIGDKVRIGEEEWELARFKKRLFKRHGLIYLRKAGG